MSPTLTAPAWVASYVGLPWLARGRDAQGVDCWGLVLALYAQRYGITLPTLDGEYEDVHDGLDISRVVRHTSRRFVQVPSTEVTEGDLVLLRIGHHPCHVGVVVGWPWFLHAREDTKGSVLERLDAQPWRNRIEGYWRWDR